MALVLLCLGVATTACRRESTPKTARDWARALLDKYPYPAVTGADGQGEDGRLAPLLDSYLLYLSAESDEELLAAAASFDEVVTEIPDLTEAHLLRGVCLVLAQRHQEALAPLEAVVAEAPRFPPARWFLAQALFGLGRDEEALGHLPVIVEIGGEYAPEADQILAVAALESD
ncbi:MAG: tetratricopeptide repeat protein [Acidobacteriota bacterium]